MRNLTSWQGTCGNEPQYILGGDQETGEVEVR